MATASINRSSSTPTTTSMNDALPPASGPSSATPMANRTLNTAQPAMLAATSGRPAPRMVGRRKADSIRVIAA